jgi:hypothetical protein
LFNIRFLKPQKKNVTLKLKMAQRPARLKIPTAKLVDSNNTEPFALSSHHDTVAAHARSQAQAASSSGPNPVTESVGQPASYSITASVATSVATSTPDKRATVVDADDDAEDNNSTKNNGDVSDDDDGVSSSKGQPKKKKRRCARREGS